MFALSLLGLVLVLPWTTFGAGTESFDEQLHLRPLPDGSVNARFSFVTTTPNPHTHHSLSPAPLLALLRAHDAHGFSLALTAGSWDHSRWGYPLGETGGTGAELWAWMGEAENADERHHALLHSVSGLFCASLGQALTNSFTTRPYIPHLTSSTDPSPYHSTSPPSSLCTENLTPFLKLIPSKGRSGISGLLRAHRVFEGRWHSMTVKVERQTEGAVRVELAFEVVWDLVGRKKHGGLSNLSLEKISKAALPAPFPPASSSLLTLELPEWQGLEAKDFTLDPVLNFVTRTTVGDVDRVTWDLKSVGLGFDFDLHHADSSSFFTFPKSYARPPLSIQRNLLGSSQTSGVFLTTLINSSPFPREAVLMEEWPWWVGPWLGERTLTVDGVVRDDLIPSLSYTPSLPHTRPSTLLTHIVLPANTTLVLRTPFVKQFLKYNEHLPDASRGFELWAAVLFPVPLPVDLDPGREEPSRVYTTNLLVDLAVPDFSMPYNVIIMTSTVVALFFGSIFNPLTRRLMAVRVEGGPVVGRMEDEDWDAPDVSEEVKLVVDAGSADTPNLSMSDPH